MTTLSAAVSTPNTRLTTGLATHSALVVLRACHGLVHQFGCQFGKITNVQTDPRAMQFGVKFTF
jgi:hypothetical protein